MSEGGGGLWRWVRDLFAARPPAAAAPTPAPAPPRTLREGFFEEMLESTRFLERYPEYAGVLARMDPIATNTVDVMAVGLRRWDDPRSRIQLLVNVEYFEAHPEHRAGVLLHEIQHVVLGHLTSAKFHAVMHPRIMELAMELSADEGITDLLPPNGLELEVFACFGVRRGQSTMERYRLLSAAYERGELEMAEWWSGRMRDTHRPRQCGSQAAGLGDLIDARSDGASARNWNREHWGMGAPSSRREIEQMKREIAEHLRGERGGEDDPLQNGTQRRVAKELQRVVMESGEHRSLDWRRVLREAFPYRRLVRPDYLRPNRRFPQRVGEVPGRSRRPPKPALLVGVDTSGSMTGETLDRVALEIRRLALHARLTIVECDAVVHRVYPMTDRLGPFVGGGDTDFSPVFDEARGAHHLEGLVYFTDGKGNMPELPPSLPTLWALTHEDPFVADWGTIVRLSA